MPLLFWLLTGTGAALVTIGYVLIFKGYYEVGQILTAIGGVLAIIYMTIFAVQNC